MKFYTIRQAMEQLAPGARQQGSDRNGGKQTAERRTTMKHTLRMRVLAHVRSVKYASIQDVVVALDMVYSTAAAQLLALFKEGLIKKVKGDSFGFIVGSPKCLYIAVKEEEGVKCEE